MLGKFTIGALIIVVVYITLLMFMYKAEVKLKEEQLELTEAKFTDLRHRIEIYFRENKNDEDNEENEE